MKPPKTIYVHKYAAHIFAEKEDRSNTVEYSLKGEELRSVLRYIKRWRLNEIDRNALTVLGIIEREIERMLKK